MSKNLIGLKLEEKVRLGIEKFYLDTKNSHNVEELKLCCDQLLELTYRYSSKKNNRPNKSLNVFLKYNDLKISKENKVKNEIEKKKKANYKDHLSRFKILRDRGYSYREISKYAKSDLNIKVSNETIRKALINYYV